MEEAGVPIVARDTSAARALYIRLIDAWWEVIKHGKAGMTTLDLPAITLQSLYNHFRHPVET